MRHHGRSAMTRESGPDQSLDSLKLVHVARAQQPACLEHDNPLYVADRDGERIERGEGEPRDRGMVIRKPLGRPGSPRSTSGKSASMCAWPKPLNAVDAADDSSTWSSVCALPSKLYE